MQAELECLLYRSQITHRIGPLHMFLLVERARRANLAHHITGKLMYVDTSFAHYIEGPRDSIEKLWTKLQADTRHHSLELLDRHPIKRRQIPESPLVFSSSAYFQQYQMRDFSPVTRADLEAFIERYRAT